MKSRHDRQDSGNTQDGSRRQIVFIHSVPPLIGVFDRLSADLQENTTTLHILDEPLLKKVQQQGEFLEMDYERLRSHVHSAEMISACMVIVTCSTFSPAVDMIRSSASIPVLKIDEKMIERAVETGLSIGVVATAASTIQPTETSLRRTAEGRGKKISIQTMLVENALPLLLKGEAQKHDELVISAIREISSKVEVIVLAQASLARVMEYLPRDVMQIPILASPYLVLEQAREILNKP